MDGRDGQHPVQEGQLAGMYVDGRSFGHSGRLVQACPLSMGAGAWSFTLWRRSSGRCIFVFFAAKVFMVASAVVGAGTVLLCSLNLLWWPVCQHRYRASGQGGVSANQCFGRRSVPWPTANRLWSTPWWLLEATFGEAVPGTLPCRRVPRCHL